MESHVANRDDLCTVFIQRIEAKAGRGTAFGEALKAVKLEYTVASIAWTQGRAERAERSTVPIDMSRSMLDKVVSQSLVNVQDSRS